MSAETNITPESNDIANNGFATEQPTDHETTLMALINGHRDLQLLETVLKLAIRTKVHDEENDIEVTMLPLGAVVRLDQIISQLSRGIAASIEEVKAKIADLPAADEQEPATAD